MVINHPYQTTLLSSVPIEKSIQLLRSMAAVKQVLPVEMKRPHDFRVLGVYQENEQLPVFYQPIVDHDPNTGRLSVYIDLRPYLSSVEQDGETIKLKTNVDALNLLFQAAIASGVWQDTPSRVTSISPVPGQAYATLLAESLKRKLGIDERATFNVMVAFLTFYYTRELNSTTDYSPMQAVQLSHALAKRFSLPPSMYEGILTSITPADLTSLGTMVDFIKKQEWSPRLKTITLKDVTALVMNNFIGQGNPRETVVAGLEYPPIWIALCNRIASSVFYSKLPLGQIIKRAERGNQVDEFRKQMTYHFS